MGANIGTSITSTLVAFGNIVTPTEFRNAIACAVLPAGFNWCTVLILMPLEMGFGMIEQLTILCTKGINATEVGKEESIDPIAFITDPIQQYFLTINKEGLGVTGYTGSFVKYCKEKAGVCEEYCITGLNCTYESSTTCMKMGPDFDCQLSGRSIEDSWDVMYGEKCTKKEVHMWVNACWSDTLVGGICLGIAFLLMFISLGGVVKCLKAVLEGWITEMIHKNIDKNLPYPFGWLTEYIYIAVGFGITIAVQSSSIVLAILTPIVGIGVISIDRCYPITVGSKIGTTITGIIAAYANTGTGFRSAMQVSLSHVFFNAFGFLLFFVVPITRQVPIGIDAVFRWVQNSVRICDTGSQYWDSRFLNF